MLREAEKDALGGFEGIYLRRRSPPPSREGLGSREMLKAYGRLGFIAARRGEGKP